MKREGMSRFVAASLVEGLIPKESEPIPAFDDGSAVEAGGDKISADDGSDTDEAWRLQRALRLAQAEADDSTGGDAPGQ